MPILCFTTYSYLAEYHIVHGLSSLDKLLGISKVQPNNRITIIRQVQKKLRINVGDVIMYVEDDNGNIMIQKIQIKPANRLSPE